MKATRHAVFLAGTLNLAFEAGQRITRPMLFELIDALEKATKEDGLILRQHEQPHMQPQALPERRPGPCLAGVHSNARTAVTPVMCTCLSPSGCCGNAGRSPSGAHCRGHLAPTLEDAS